MPLNPADLHQFSGTDRHYAWSPLFRNVRLTEGAKYVADNGGGQGAYWLMDAIASYQPDLKKHEWARSMQFWHLDVRNQSAVLTCREDSGVEPAVTQEIEYTDFEQSIDLWVVRQEAPGGGYMVIMLPGEY
jgi:hypothetical protein